VGITNICLHTVHALRVMQAMAPLSASHLALQRMECLPSHLPIATLWRQSAVNLQ